ncbi:hypothetical protein AMTRI_Chr13g90510 [Amborella trichopoda]
MEVEVKLQLPDATAHQKLSALLSPFHKKTHLQENAFFDGPNQELSSRRLVLRLRFYDNDTHCVISLKGKSVIVDGIARAEEEEEEFDSSLGRACLGEPWRLTRSNSQLVQRIVNEFALSDFVYLGGFRNLRAVHEWDGLVLEVDETRFGFGTSYEVECETAEPERAREMLEGLLKENAVPYTYSTVSKFAVFRSGKLPE